MKVHVKVVNTYNDVPVIEVSFDGIKIRFWDNEVKDLRLKEGGA
jgi:hypothetical protein